MSPDRDEHRVKLALLALGLQISDRTIGHHAYAEGGDPFDLGRQHIPRHPVGGDAVAHHAARLRTGVVDLDLVSEHRQVVRGRKPTRSAAHNEYPLAAAHRRWNEL